MDINCTAHGVDRAGKLDQGTVTRGLDDANTLLLGKVMFRKEFLKIEVDRAMQLAFEALGELVAMHDAAKNFKSAEQAALQKAAQWSKQGRSLAIPSVGNVRAHCKTFMQKSDHFAGILLNIVRLFYPAQQMNWDNAYALAKAQYGEDDNFTKVMMHATPLLKLVRNARDCLEHRNEGVTTTDFQLEQNGTIAPPTIAIDFRQTSHECCPVSSFMEGAEKALLDSFEMIVVHLCSKHVQPFAGCPIVVSLLPENYRTAWHVRFGYGMYYQDGQFAPIG